MTLRTFEATLDEGYTTTVVCNVPASALPVVHAQKAIILLHGFPDTCHTWGKVISCLDERYPHLFIAAPMLKGYETATTEHACFQEAARDVLKLVKLYAPGAEIHVVGHDWGAIVAYYLAAKYPDQISSCTTLAIPLNILQRPIQTLLCNPKQLWLSSYMLTMLFPRLCRLRVTPKYIAKLWKTWSPKLRVSDDEIVEIYKVLTQPGVMRASTGYYRRLFGHFRARFFSPKLNGFNIDRRKIPLKILGGELDGCISSALFYKDQKRLPGAIMVLPGIGHFMQRENPELVADLIVQNIEVGDETENPY